MTATRVIGAATLAAAWALAAWLLWDTVVPAGVDPPPVDASAVAPDLERRERHAAFLRWLGVALLVVQLIVLAALARRPPRVPGPALVRAALLAAAVVLALAAARLPFVVAAHWWQRRYEIRHQGYGGRLVDLLPSLGTALAVGVVAAVVLVALARRLGARWWVAGAPAVALIGAAVIVVQPLLTPRLDPLADERVVARVEALAQRQGLAPPEVELQEFATRTRAVNALALGIGPTTRVILWDTALALPPRELDFLVAHELAHVLRKHLWKGAAWFALLALPGIALVARVADLREPAQVPRAALAIALFALAVSPLGNAVSRRYEAEADWVAVRTTGDGPGGRALLERLGALALSDPDPPQPATALFGTHPPLVARVALVSAADRSPGGS